ncbi:ECF transporter S component [Facklamia sp. DSM 111018]|uniref:Riboflavin transporter n=1 Tax=Facklamia lactis TaxID=2749967 RepID=A0ABS0LMT4_9LACT|nr:ECF transporter S component [Facklamia lactis]MBG9979840.1 ECF transporter S component [Facklamia lactis]MBG9985480.1 ECF transporter S component [Facklamia lactis]
MKKKKLTQMVLLAILGAWAIVLRMFDFPILPFAPFLKVDLSDLMVLIGMLIAGPNGIIAVAGVRDGLNYLLKGGEAGIPIGSMMSFIASLCMFLPTHFILSRAKNFASRHIYLLMTLSLVVSLTISMAVLNYYITLPIYVNVMHFPIENFLNYVLTLIVPFNLIKGLILAVGQILIIKLVAPAIYKKGMLNSAYLSEIYFEHQQLFNQ